MKKIDIKNDSFELNGVQWHVADDVTIGRLPELEKVLHHFINGLDVQEQQLILKEVYDDMNSMKFADAGRKIYNLYNATVVKKAGMPHPKLLIATMFVNKKDEDITKWSMDMAIEKLTAWEGAESSFFFELADRLVKDILYKIFGISENFSEAILEVGNARSQREQPVTVQSPLNIGKLKTTLKKNG